MDFIEALEYGMHFAASIVNLPPKKMCGIDSCGMLISAVHHKQGEERLNFLMVDDKIPAGTKLF